MRLPIPLSTKLPHTRPKESAENYMTGKEYEANVLAEDMKLFVGMKLTNESKGIQRGTSKKLGNKVA